ncbi:O-antigen ligase family protein [Variovorax sp. J22R24]|uniref:O-antigen ligase family protein n=1 Tax=Variovorax gracilis TaxID=3053502 RepID=UPI002576E137|nr:O-antigen ligase family protein [Variovorax sp. J22R24]MDM0103695.1 O-antigen ligase family protein [Variovorax sp. J22R24]
MRRIFEISVASLLVGSIVFPTVFVQAKAVAFLIALLSAVHLLVSRGATIRSDIGIFWIGYPILGLAWSLYGVASGNPGAVPVLSVMFVYPLLFPVLAFCYEKDNEHSLYGVLKFSAWILVLLNLMYIVSSSFLDGGGIAPVMQEVFGDNAVVDDAEEYFKFTLPNVSSLLFLIPFFFAATAFGYSRVTLCNAALVFLLFAVGVLSGRRALLMSVVLGPLLAYFLTYGSRRIHVGLVNFARLRLIILTVAPLVFIWLFYSDRAGFYVEQLFSVFDFSENASNVERRLQFEALWGGLKDSPFFGLGAGAAASYSRSIDQPWAYELSYMAFAFQYGLIGFSLYASGLCFIVLGLRRFVIYSGRNDFSFCVLSGLISFLIANATNPYLGKFDFMWVIFIPLALVGCRSGNIASEVAR